MAKHDRYVTRTAHELNATVSEMVENLSDSVDQS